MTALDCNALARLPYAGRPRAGAVDGKLARHDDPGGAQERTGGDRRRRPGHFGPDGDQAQCAESKAAWRRQRDRRLRRRHGRRLHPVRAARAEARAASRGLDARRGRARQGLADRQISEEPRGDDDRRRQGGDPGADRQWRRARARLRGRGDRLGRQFRPRRRDGPARLRGRCGDPGPQGDGNRRRNLRLHQRQFDGGDAGERELTDWTVERLAWADEALGEIDLPKRVMRFRSGFGSGLSRRASDPPGTVWAVGDRGPNIKVKVAVQLYGLDRLEALRAEEGAKIMPRLDLGPAIAELRVAGGRVELVRSLRIADAGGRPVSGLPVPGGPHMHCEPAFDLDGEPLDPDPSGLDTEGIAALPDGGFWVGDEFGPSLVRLDRDGRVLKRLVPEGTFLDAAAYPVEARLPALAARRQLNRGFEAITLSPDGKWLFLAFQSPLAHPDERAHEQAGHVRLWRLDSETGEVAAQFLYPLDPPE